MTNEQDKDNSSPADRLDQIKQESQEDASSYYAQGKSEDDAMTEEDFNKPVPPVDEEKEEMNLMKAMAYLGFGMGALAIIVILFFLRDLNHKVGDVDAAVGTLEEKFGPLKKEVDESLAKVNADVSQLKDRFGNYERQAAVTELKRALVAIQTVTENTGPDVKAKSGQVVASIENLLRELGAEIPGTTSASGAVAPIPAPAAGTPATEEKPFEIILDQPATEPAPTADAHPAEEPVAEQAPPAEEAPAEEAPAEEAPSAEEPADEAAGAEGDGSDDEEDEEDE
ncbi:MAG: hypothetical protein OEZ51_02220 [Nitrospinota bacterium]|nr:hypothetical protein [Nitrospinota bacterium]